MNVEVWDIVWPIVILLIIIGVLAAIREWVTEKLVPLCYIVSLITYFILYPLKWVWRQISRPFKALRRLLRIQRTKSMTLFGGKGLFFFMLFCTLFSATTITLIETGAVGGPSLLENALNELPLFALVTVLDLSGSAFSVHALFDFALLSALSFAFMGKMRHLKMGIRIVYNLIFTMFGSCLLFWLPDTWYGPIANLFDHISVLWKKLPDINVYLAILSVFYIILLVYIALVVYALVAREAVVSVVYSLFPLGVLLAIVFVLSYLPIPEWIGEIIAFVSIIGLSIYITQTRTDFEDEWDDENDDDEDDDDLPAPTKKSPTPNGQTPTPTTPVRSPVQTPYTDRHLTTPTWKDRKS